MRGSNAKFFSRVIIVTALVCVCAFLALVWAGNATAQTQKAKSKSTYGEAQATKQTPYREYRGVSLGMTAEEARAKLGEPALKGDDQDYYIFTGNESAQIAYNAARKVVTISTDYAGGVGAPDYRAVVGANLQVRPDGSMYLLVRHEREGYWVSYNKSAGSVPVVTITLGAS